MKSWKRGALLSLLLSALGPTAGAGEPVAVESRAGFADVQLRASIVYAGGGRESIREMGLASLALGPRIEFCSPGLPAAEFRLILFAGGSALRVPGSFFTERGRAVLEPHPAALQNGLGTTLAALCEARHGAEACAATFAGLEPRLERARLSLTARRQPDGIAARLRARFEVAFVDPVTEEEVIRARFAFREARPLMLRPPANVQGVCLTVISLGS